MTLYVGQKVVKVKCPVDAPNYPSSARLVLGAIYTIREIDLRAVNLHGMATIRLVEVVNDPLIMTKLGMWEIGYRPDGFRPITDISIFTKMLTPKRQKASAVI